MAQMVVLQDLALKKHESRTCCKCGRLSHLSRDCSERKSEKRNNSQRLVEAPEDEDTDKMVDIFAHLGKMQQNTQATDDNADNTRYRFTKQMTLANGIAQEALVDTDATVSSVS